MNKFKNIGTPLIISILTITVCLFVLSKIENNIPIVMSWRTVSQLISLLGTALLAITFVLSSRFSIVETWFGGMDKVYKVHHIAGGVAFVLLLHHPLLLLIESIPNYNLGLKYVWFSDTLAYNAGVASLYSMMLMLIFTFLINLPYNLWKRTHEFMGLALLFASIHVVTISSDVSRFYPLRFWIIFLLALALISALYVRFLYKLLGSRYLCIVESVIRVGDIYKIVLVPKGRRPRVKPGQFFSLKFPKINNETHPFSVVSYADGKLEFGIKILGDYTLNLEKLKNGDAAEVVGPFGRFYEGLSTDKDMVWIAGGIGITPFVSMLEHELEIKKSNKVHLFYCFRNAEDAYYLDRLNELAKKSSGRFKIVSFCSEEKGHLDIDKMTSILEDIKTKKFLLCGPAQMMHTLSTQLRQRSLKRRDIVFEDFNYK